MNFIKLMQVFNYFNSAQIKKLNYEIQFSTVV